MFKYTFKLHEMIANGIGKFLDESSLSLKTNCVTPCLTAISAFF